MQTYLRLTPSEEEEERRLLESSEFAEVREATDTVLGRMEERARREERWQTMQQALLAVIH